MKPATILSQSEGQRLLRYAAQLHVLASLLAGDKPKRRRRRKAKATATPKAKKSAKPGTKKYPVETTTN